MPTYRVLLTVAVDVDVDDKADAYNKAVDLMEDQWATVVGKGRTGDAMVTEVTLESELVADQEARQRRTAASKEELRYYGHRGGLVLGPYGDAELAGPVRARALLERTAPGLDAYCVRAATLAEARTRINAFVDQV